jgi:hypothetical protein
MQRGEANTLMLKTRQIHPIIERRLGPVVKQRDETIIAPNPNTLNKRISLMVESFTLNKMNNFYIKE